jgi:hypothetical protein
MTGGSAAVDAGGALSLPGDGAQHLLALGTRPAADELIMMLKVGRAQYILPAPDSLHYMYASCLHTHLWPSSCVCRHVVFVCCAH